jgi:hypothetical protein
MNAETTVPIGPRGSCSRRGSRRLDIVVTGTGSWLIGGGDQDDADGN